MEQQGMGEEQFAEYQEKWASDFEETASYMIQSSFLIDKIAADNNLRAGPADIEAKLKEYAAQTGIDFARVAEFYNEDDRRARLAYQITEEKVLEFLISKSDLKEVGKEEIEKEEAKK
jgi:trigger factor